LREHALKMEAAEAGFLCKTHVNQLHPLPHLRTADYVKLFSRTAGNPVCGLSPVD
jgi:hypothetical protein